jgi:Galactose oxidase, central domain/Tyrosine-protein kinase ephrin type A/B receptor-like
MQPSSGNLPGIKDSASMAYYNNTLYLYGGSYQFDELASEYGLFAYNLDIKTWTKINSTENRIKTYFHSAHIYKNYMYVLYGYMETGSYNQFWRLNFNNFIWESLGNSTGDPMEFYGFFQSGSVLTMILGISGDSFFNSINTIDFDGNFLNPKIISKNYDMPRKRKGHCMIKLQNLLFVFGGLAEDGITYLNDIWTYDPDKDLWTQLKISGILPEPRAYASCISLSGNLLLQGGKGDSISTKQYFFNYKSKVWGVINMSGGSYANRYGSCIASTESAIYIISGQISDEFTSDILVYDILTGSLSLAQNTGSIKIELAYHSCWERSGAIYVASGQDANTKPNFYIYKLFFNRLQNSVYKYRVSIVKSLTSAIGSKTSAIITGNYAVLVSGSEWNTVIFPSIFFINLDSYQITRLNLTGIYAYSYGASLYKNSIYVFGGGDHRNLMVNPDGAVNNLYKITTDHNDPIQFECSSGTNGTNCSFCSEGYYDSGNNTCIACPQGTYSNVVGATSIFQCAYCAKGTYNDIIGNFYCKECSINQVCPIGSSSGLDYYDYPQSSTQQPDSYQSNTNYVNSIYSIIQYIGISGCFVVMLFIALFHKLRQSIKKIDIFTDKHEVKLKKPIISKKTSIGGFFSILFVFIIIITISPLILTYFLDNITETKNLVPSIIYDQAISSDNFIVAFYLYQFNGICIDDQGKCYSYIYTQEVSMNYTSKTTVCSKHNGSLNGCAYKIYYQNLYLSSSSSVTLNIRQPNTFVGFIGYNITTGSSIPGQVSNIYQMIYVTDPSTVFKGNSPTVLNLDVTPSVFFT